MDRSLEEVISEKKRRDYDGRRPRRQNNFPRDGVRKVLYHPPCVTPIYRSTFFSQQRSRDANPNTPDTIYTSIRDEPKDLDRDWVHDKFENNDDNRRPFRGSRDRRHDRYSPEIEQADGAKLRVDNVHYDLNEDDLEELFTRLGPVTAVSLQYDRAGRSNGTAFITYESLADARRAIREYDGANANGQPIHLTLMRMAPPKSAPRAPRNPFDTAQKPSRSLFDRISSPPRRGRERSASPTRARASDVSRPAPDGVDRYVPGDRSRSPRPRRGGRDVGRRPGARREDSGRRHGGGRGESGRAQARDGRPRKTQEELDAEMEDYWGNKNGDVEAKSDGVVQNGTTSGADLAVVDDGDIDMIE